MSKSGEVILTYIQFADTFEIKKRPAVVLFESMGNIVVAGITSNTKMRGISLTSEDGAAVPCIIKPNYIFTISENMIVKKLFSLTSSKKKLLYGAVTTHLRALNE